jgi:sulfonate transport system permease protein
VEGQLAVGRGVALPAVEGPRPAAPAVERRRGAFLISLALPLAILVAWELATVSGYFKPHQLPTPQATLQTAIDQAASGRLWAHVSTSVVRVFSGFLIGATAAIVLAVVVGLSRQLERAVDPTIQAIRMIPSLAWVPLLLLWMGIDEAPKITLIAIGSFFPVYLSVVAGIRDVDRKFIELGMMYGLRGFSLAREIVVPAALPFLVVGLRAGLGQGWLFLVAAELIAASRGLGFMLTDGQSMSRVDIVMTAIVLLAVLGKTSDSILKYAERRLLSWRDVYEGS